MEEEILNRRWKNVDKLLAKYSKDYKKLNRKTQDKLQDVFNLIKVSYQDLNKPISKQEKARLDRFILELQESGLLNDYYGYKARLILNKKKVTYSEMLEIMIEGCYIQEDNELDEINNNYYYEIADNSYRQGIKEANIIKPLHLHIPFETMYLLLNIPLLNATAEAYLKALELNNAEELYKRALMILQQGNSVDINSKELQELFKKQQNRIINIREEEQPTGAISNITDNLVNDAYLQVAKDNDIQKVRFVAEMDERTTRMCRNMNGMIFNVQAENKFKRYFGYDAKHLYYKTITCYGMFKGLNMPPIDNHFHWCRSTLTYQLDLNRQELNERLMTTREKQMINKWESSDFYDINRKMYMGEELSNRERQMVNTLYTALNKVPYYKTKENEYIIRTLEIKNQSDIDRIIKQHPLNEIYTSPSFESYSIKKGYHDNPNVYFYIKGSKKARDMLKYNTVDGNVEVLYQYGNQFITKDYQYIDGKHYFLLEEYDG